MDHHQRVVGHIPRNPKLLIIANTQERVEIPLRQDSGIFQAIPMSEDVLTPNGAAGSNSQGKSRILIQKNQSERIPQATCSNRPQRSTCFADDDDDFMDNPVSHPQNRTRTSPRLASNRSNRGSQPSAARTIDTLFFSMRRQSPMPSKVPSGGPIKRKSNQLATCPLRVQREECHADRISCNDGSETYGRLPWKSPMCTCYALLEVQPHVIAPSFQHYTHMSYDVPVVSHQLSANLALLDGPLGNDMRAVAVKLVWLQKYKVLAIHCYYCSSI